MFSIRTWVETLSFLPRVSSHPTHKICDECTSFHLHRVDIYDVKLHNPRAVLKPIGQGEFTPWSGCLGSGDKPFYHFFRGEVLETL